MLGERVGGHKYDRLQGLSHFRHTSWLHSSERCTCGCCDCEMGRRCCGSVRWSGVTISVYARTAWPRHFARQRWSGTETKEGTEPEWGSNSMHPKCDCHLDTTSGRVRRLNRCNTVDGWCIDVLETIHDCHLGTESTCATHCRRKEQLESDAEGL